MRIDESSHRKLLLALAGRNKTPTMTVAKNVFNIATMFLHASLGIGSAGARAEEVVIDYVSCGTGCVQKIRQLGPVSRTTYGYPKVPVSITTVLQPGPRNPQLGFNKNGDPITKWRGELYPTIDKYWVIADCQGKRVGLYAKDSDGADATWNFAFIDGLPNNCHSACGRSYDQWRLLCKANGLF